MCLIVPKGTKPTITTEDKTVYKLLRKPYLKSQRGLVSIFWNYSYKFKRLNKTELALTNCMTACCTIDEMQIHKALPGWKGENNQVAEAYGQGFHYITDLESYRKLKDKDNKDEQFYKCIIPSGSLIVEAWGLGVTNQIIITKELA